MPGVLFFHWLAIPALGQNVRVALEDILTSEEDDRSNLGVLSPMSHPSPLPATTTTGGQTHRLIQRGRIEDHARRIPGSGAPTFRQGELVVEIGAPAVRVQSG